jgi:repressor LexA
MDPITVTAHAVENITRLLALKGWTQRVLGEKTGLAQPDVSRLMRPGRATSLATLTRVADALGVQVWELLRPAELLTPVTQPIHRAEPGTGRRIPDLGKVAAGTAIDPKADHDTTEVWGLPDIGEFVIFTVAGDSMVDALIASGDRVIVRLQPDAESGEEVVCQIDGKLTLKTFHIGKGDKKGYWLLPHNDECEPIRVDAAHDPRIIGVLFEVRRKAKNGRRPKGKK